MANKNDISDLVEFFAATLFIIFGFLALAGYGVSLIDKKYICMLDAKISGYLEYAEQQWEAAAR